MISKSWSRILIDIECGISSCMCSALGWLEMLYTGIVSNRHKVYSCQVSVCIVQIMIRKKVLLENIKMMILISKY